MRTIPLLSAAALLLLTAASTANAQQTAYAIGNGGSTLIRFQTNDPGSAVAVGNFSLGGNSTFLDSIDFRTLNGQLYGYLDATDTLYRVDTNTAALTAVASSTGSAATNTFFLGMDFNPTIDRVRVVTDSTQNLVYDPNASNPATVATPLFYGAGDPNANRNALIIDNAYTNNVSGIFTSTTQYGIDYGLNNLVTIANNAGTLATVGSLGVDATEYTGFDIYTTITGTNTAYAIFGNGTTAGFYTVNLNTGAATSVGSFGNRFGAVYSLAVTPNVVVPEPGTVALVATGLLPLVGVAVRRRRRSGATS